MNAAATNGMTRMTDVTVPLLTNSKALVKGERLILEVQTKQQPTSNKAATEAWKVAHKANEKRKESEKHEKPRPKKQPKLSVNPQQSTVTNTEVL